jgi:hypothetical protein
MRLRSSWPGRGGALEISKQVTAKLQDKKRMFTKQLLDTICQKNSPS